ncbi:MAG: hypothetical protein BKP49_02785 [Treponema sp. CETP13]|nr:MAG: hypothetical protein BKP49_02785 [Treponema sp. CETP13]
MTTQTLFIIGALCLAGSIASLMSLLVTLLVKKIYKKQLFVLGNNNLIWLCVLLSGFLICMSLFLCTSTWKQFLSNIFDDNLSFYIIVMIVSFVIVIFRRYLFIPVCICYVLYSGIAYFVFYSECMNADTSFTVLATQKEDSIPVQINIEYVNVSPKLLLPFSQTWITSVKSTVISGIDFDKRQSVFIINLFSNFLFSHVTQKTVQVTIPIPKIPPESWEIILSAHNRVLQSDLKRIF